MTLAAAGRKLPTIDWRAIALNTLAALAPAIKDSGRISDTCSASSLGILDLLEEMPWRSLAPRRFGSCATQIGADSVQVL